MHYFPCTVIGVFIKTWHAKWLMIARFSVCCSSLLLVAGATKLRLLTNVIILYILVQ